MLIFSSHITPRLQYIIDFIATEISAESWELTSDPVFFISSYKNKINYSHQPFSGNVLHIPPHTLLFEQTITPQTITCTKQNKTTIFFQNNSGIGFDIFAASFYLLCRYEEYLPHIKDVYGRYSIENALSYKEGFIQQPLINTWMQQFSVLLLKTFPTFLTRHSRFNFLPTYDIDMAWSYHHKGILRNTGAIFKDILTFNATAINKRLKVLTNKEQDPYNNFDWLDRLHEKSNISPKYFFLVAEKTSVRDKNISPHHPAMKQLIKNLAAKYDLGLHPSWQSANHQRLLLKEQLVLVNIIGKPVTLSRQHYLRITFPDTYNRLIAAGINQDFSMGWADINGFRASVASPFLWYDLRKEKITGLKLFPFCFMDATSVYYKKETPEQAERELKKLYDTVKNVNGIFCTLFHNDTFMNTAWKTIYEALLQYAVQ